MAATAKTTTVVMLPLVITRLARLWAREASERDQEYWQAALEGAISEWCSEQEASVINALTTSLGIRMNVIRLKHELCVKVQENWECGDLAIDCCGCSFHLTPPPK